MSKKSKQKRTKRTNSTFTTGTTASRPESSNRLAWLKNAVRSSLAPIRRGIAERCDVPLEKLTLLLLAARGERIDDEEAIPLYTHDGVAVLVTAAAAGKVAVTSGFILPREANSGTEGPLLTSDDQKADWPASLDEDRSVL